MSFIATGKTESTPPPKLTNDPFFPQITLAVFRDSMGIDETMTDARTSAALQAAIIRVNNELKGWKENQSANSLSDIEEGNIQLEHFYRRAIFHQAKADLISKYRDYDSTKSGHERADQMIETVDDYRRIAREAIRAFLSIPRITVELI